MPRISFKAIVAGAIVYAGATYGGYSYMRAKRLSEELGGDLPTESERISTFNKLAPNYDEHIDLEEFFSGINWFRRRLLKTAEGDVLEVGCGTGRNFAYYDMGKLTSLTATDKSEEMVAAAKKKSKRYQANVFVADAQTLSDDLPVDKRKYDCVVDTFGICSYEQPVQALKQMVQVLKHPTGRILLLEHGRSTTWPRVSAYLDKAAHHHAHKWGCYFNRDIESIVAQAGLRIVSARHHHFGTCYELVCVPAEDSGKPET